MNVQIFQENIGNVAQTIFEHIEGNIGQLPCIMDYFNLGNEIVFIT